MSTRITALHREKHGLTESWWDAPISNRLTAAFQVGRYLNQLDWQFQFLLFFHRPIDKRIVNEVLGRLMAISYEFVVSPPNPLYDAIGFIRDHCETWLCSEAVADDAAACFDERWISFEESPSKERRRDLIASRTRRPILDVLRHAFFKAITDSEKWALELGACVDQGGRRSDIADFFEYEITFSDPARLAETDAGGNEQDWLIKERRLPAFEAGEMAADPAWPHTLQALLRKGDVSSEVTIAGRLSKHTNLQERPGILMTIEKLDHEIRQRLCELSENDLCDPPQCEDVKRTFTIPEEYRSRIMTKKEAVVYHNGQNVSNPTVYIDRLINQGHMTPPMGRGQRWQFNVCNFPENVREEMRRSLAAKI